MLSMIGAVVGAILSTFCGPTTLYYTEFTSQQPELTYEVYDSNGHGFGDACGTDACTTFERQGNKTYGKFTISPGPAPEHYQNAATSQVPVPADGSPAPTDAGPYSLTNGHSITMETKIKFSSNYGLLGEGGAQGSSGIVFWNSSIDQNGQTPEYDQIGILWTAADVLGGAFAGLTATSLVNVAPVGLSYPTELAGLSDWFKVKMVWAQDNQGIQSVAYHIDGELVATHVLPVQLQGLSLEIWNDNQEPQFCETGICFAFSAPTEPQSLYVDYVKVTQA